MSKNDPVQSAVVPTWIPTACELLDQPDGPRSLGELAAAIGMSPSHLQRSFTRHVGVSPKRYGDNRRLERLRSGLRSDDNVATAIADAGFASSSTVYDAADSTLGMTPGRFGRGGEGVEIAYSLLASDLGDVLVAASDRGLVAVRFGSGPALVAEIKAELPRASILRDERLVHDDAAEILRRISGELAAKPLRVDIAATSFQARVWAALRSIPAGETWSYSGLAAAVGSRSSVRAVAHACAMNPVAVVIPCHRVIRADGSLAGYRWGLERKAALLDREAATTLRLEQLNGRAGSGSAARSG